MSTEAFLKSLDVELVARFDQCRDEQAFAQLVRRHGPMVMGVARGVQRHEQDAEDAFQATFLALAAAVDRVKDPGAVAAWLHRTALRSARTIQRRNFKWERKMIAKRQEADVATDSGQQQYELRELLHAELSRLPQRYRSAIVLCDLEGRTHQEAARQLAVSRPTVSSRIAEGRRLLKQRLTRRGIPLTLAMLSGRIKNCRDAHASVPSELVHETTRQATLFAAGANLAEAGISKHVINAANQMVHIMSTKKVAAILVLTTVILLAAGVGFSQQQSATAQPFEFGEVMKFSEPINLPDTWNLSPHLSPDKLVVCQRQILR